MRYIKTLVIISITAISLSAPIHAATDTTIIPGISPNSNIALNNPERLKFMILTLVTPEVQKSVDEFYAPYMTISPTYWACYGSEIENIKGDACDSRYTVQILILPYVGPHMAVGKDRVTVEINGSGAVTITKFEHVENYELTWNLKGLIKKLPPISD